MNKETLQQIEQRISKYKKERDTIKETMKHLNMSHEKKLIELTTHHQGEMSLLREELDQRVTEVMVWKQKADKYKLKCHEMKKEFKEGMSQLSAELRERNDYIASLSLPLEREEEFEYHHHEENEEESISLPHPSLIGST